jgi:intracellular sulfur oxidation DsrE/DsrF family protein
MNPRRTFLSRLGMAAAAIGLGRATASAAFRSAPGPGGPSDWQPARDAKDDWFDQLPGRHRLFFDAVTAAGASGAMAFADNYFTANKNGYGLEPTDLAVAICLRHSATGFAFADPFWAKYGTPLAEAMSFTDPKTSEPPAVNVYKARLDALVKRGVHFAVCDMASHRLAGAIARKVDGNAEAIYKEMTANAIGNAHFVAAGIVAVNRAQERGYSIAYTG